MIFAGESSWRAKSMETWKIWRRDDNGEDTKGRFFLSEAKRGEQWDQPKKKLTGALWRKKVGKGNEVRHSVNRGQVWREKEKRRCCRNTGCNNYKKGGRATQKKSEEHVQQGKAKPPDAVSEGRGPRRGC